MRLTRRIAIVALSAVMALSMLTACGGGGNPSTGGGSGTGSGTGTGTGTGTGEGTGGGTGSGTGTGEGGGTTIDPSTLTSRTAKYFARQGVNGKNRYNYIRYYDRDEQWEFEEACDGTRKYQRILAETSNEKYTKGILWDIKTKTRYEYDISGGRKNTICIYDNAAVSDYQVKSVSLVPSNPLGMSMKRVEPMTIDGKEYYCEQDTKQSWPSVYYCFEMEDTEGTNLKYIVKTSTSYTSIYEIRNISANVAPELLRIPEGRVVIRNNTLTEEMTGKDPYPNN